MIDKQSAICQVEESVKNCKDCPLHDFEVNKEQGKLFGYGNFNADIFAVGLAPSFKRRGGAFEANEGDKCGQYFEAGLNTIDLNRSDIFFDNMIKCSTPNNRELGSHEIAACSRHLKAEVEIIKPKILIGVGTQAFCWLRHAGFGIETAYMYHPSYYMRMGKSKEDYARKFKEVIDGTSFCNGR